MNRARKRAARIAMFIECAGVVPIIRGSSYSEYCASLQEQYCHLEPEVRSIARVEGRRQIRMSGLESVATHLIPVPPPAYTLAKLSLQQQWRIRANYRKRIRRWPPGMPPCPKCRIGAGMPKRSWPSRELAEQARSRHNDPGLQVYPCPAQPGFWHLGHRR